MNLSKSASQTANAFQLLPLLVLLFHEAPGLFGPWGYRETRELLHAMLPYSVNAVEDHTVGPAHAWHSPMAKENLPNCSMEHEGIFFCLSCAVHSLCFFRLSLCEKALAEYLDRKRLAFPRFYFISSADLLDILSNGTNPQLVSIALCHLCNSSCQWYHSRRPRSGTLPWLIPSLSAFSNLPYVVK